MRKKVGTIKRALSLLLIFLLSINSFAAIVSDNDGSAFVTKAEFEALKNNFNRQIDDYNSSIDGKIDGAIAAYLAGINFNYPPKILYQRVVEALGGDLVFKNSVKPTTGVNNPEINIYITSRYYVKTNQLPDTDYETWSNPDSGSYATALWACRIVPNLKHDNGGSAQYNFLETQDANSATFASGRSVTGMMSKDWVGFSAGTQAYQANIYNDATRNPEQYLKGEYTTTEESTGSGTVYTYTTTADGKKVLDSYASNWYPMERGSASYHNYKNFYAFGTSQASALANWKTYHTADNGMAIPDADKMTASTGVPTGWGTLSWGASVAEDSTTNGCWGSVTFALCKNTDGLDYSVYQWGNNTTTSIWSGSETATFSYGAEQTKTLASSSYKSTKYAVATLEKSDQTNTLPKHVLKWYKPYLTPESFALNEFSNSYLSAIVGETVKIGGGAPIVEVSSDEQTVKISFKVKSTNPVASQVRVMLSDKQFVNGDFDTANGARNFYDNVVTTGVEQPTISIVLKRTEKIWINMYDTTNGYDAALDTLQVN